MKAARLGRTPAHDKGVKVLYLHQLLLPHILNNQMYLMLRRIQHHLLFYPLGYFLLLRQIHLTHYFLQ